MDNIENKPDFMKVEEKQLTVDDLVEGEIYFVIAYRKPYIFKSKSKTLISNQIWKNQSFHGSGDFGSQLNNNSTLRHATPEEKQWFEACIKASKFIPKEEALKQVEEKPKFEVGKWYEIKNNIATYTIKIGRTYNDQLLDCDFIVKGQKGCSSGGGFGILSIKESRELKIEDEEIQNNLKEGHPDKIVEKKEDFIPEYVEVLINHYDQFTKGKIYKVKSIWKNMGFCVEKDDRGSTTNGMQTEYIKPSTKALYDLQESLKPKEIVMDKDELLKIAKKKYPIGTVIFSTGSNRNFIVNGIPKIEKHNDNISCETLLEKDKQRDVCYLYFQKEWAEIISKPEVKEEPIRGSAKEEVFPFVKGKYYSSIFYGEKWYFQFDRAPFIVQGFRKPLNDTWNNIDIPNSLGSLNLNTNFKEVTESEAKGIEVKKEVDKWTVGGWVRITKDCLSGTNKSTFKIGNIYQMSGYDSRTVWVITPTEEQASLYRDGECEWIGMEKPLEAFNNVDFGVHVHLYHPKTGICACGHNCMKEEEFTSLLPKPKETPIFKSTRTSTNQLLKTKLN